MQDSISPDSALTTTPVHKIDHFEPEGPRVSTLTPINVPLIALHYGVTRGVQIPALQPVHRSVHFYSGGLVDRIKHLPYHGSKLCTLITRSEARLFLENQQHKL